MSKPNPVTQLTKEWFEVEGVKQDSVAFGFIGRLYKTYGEDTVREAINTVKSRPSQAKCIKRPAEYLRGICRKITMEKPAPQSEGREKFQSMMKDMLKDL